MVRGKQAYDDRRLDEALRHLMRPSIVRLTWRSRDITPPPHYFSSNSTRARERYQEARLTPAQSYE